MSMYPPYFQHVFDVIFSILAVQNQSFMLLDKYRNEALKNKVDRVSCSFQNCINAVFCRHGSLTAAQQQLIRETLMKWLQAQVSTVYHFVDIHVNNEKSSYMCI